ncbi:MAG: hypothetical protein AAF193_09150, partial [Bacteroidota bacterium]
NYLIEITDPECSPEFDEGPWIPINYQTSDPNNPSTFQFTLEYESCDEVSGFIGEGASNYCSACFESIGMDCSNPDLTTLTSDPYSGLNTWWTDQSAFQELTIASSDLIGAEAHSYRVFFSKDDSDLSSGVLTIHHPQLNGDRIPETENLCNYEVDYDTDVVVGEDITATQAEVQWSNEEIYILGNLTINEDISLIGTTFIFQNSSELTIEEGVVASFEDCIFTSCETWSGIRIKTNNFDPTEVNFSGGKIEFAETGILASHSWQYYNPLDERLDLTCTAVDFIDNKTSVNIFALLDDKEFDEYTFSENCLFTRTALYEEKFPFDYDQHLTHIEYYWAGGFHIRDCVFTNDDIASRESYAELGNAISTFGCVTKIVGNEMSHFDKAIQIATAWSLWDYMIAQSNDISRCHVGIQSIGSYFSHINLNNITTGEMMVSDGSGVPWHPLDVEDNG